MPLELSSIRLPRLRAVLSPESLLLIRVVALDAVTLVANPFRTSSNRPFTAPWSSTWPRRMRTRTITIRRL